MVLQEIILNVLKWKAEGTAPQPRAPPQTSPPHHPESLTVFLLFWIFARLSPALPNIQPNWTEVSHLPLQSCLQSDSFDAVTSPYWPCMLHTLEGFEDWGFIFFLKAISLPFHLSGITLCYENENHVILSSKDLTN